MGILTHVNILVSSNADDSISSKYVRKVTDNAFRENWQSYPAYTLNYALHYYGVSSTRRVNQNHLCGSVQTAFICASSYDQFIVNGKLPETHRAIRLWSFNRHVARAEFAN